MAGLETITSQVRVGLATHHASILQIKERIADLAHKNSALTRAELLSETEKILAPTLELANQLAVAYDDIRQRTHELSTANDIGRDPLTKLNNRQVLEQQIKVQFAIFARYGNKFSVVFCELDDAERVQAEGSPNALNQAMQNVAQILSDSVRETDMVARYAGNEFILMLPETDLAGACCLAERLRTTIASSLQISISAGVAAALDTDNPKTLISRADSALYSAKTAGGNRVFQHTGRQISGISRQELSTQLATTGAK